MCVSASESCVGRRSGQRSAALHARRRDAATPDQPVSWFATGGAGLFACQVSAGFLLLLAELRTKTEEVHGPPFLLHNSASGPVLGHAEK